jgi:hypothetical protein
MDALLLGYVHGVEGVAGSDEGHGTKIAQKAHLIVFFLHDFDERIVFIIVIRLKNLGDLVRGHCLRFLGVNSLGLD